jgi:hypothetical protein
LTGVALADVAGPSGRPYSKSYARSGEGVPAAMAGGAVNTRSIHSALTERNASHRTWSVKQTTIAMYINKLGKMSCRETATRAWTKYIANIGAKMKNIGAKRNVDTISPKRILVKMPLGPLKLTNIM